MKDKKEARTKKGQFKKGHSGNPSGRKKGVVARAKAACEKYGVDPLDYMASMLSIDHKASVKEKFAAAKELADRIYGKPTQHIEQENTNYTPDNKLKIEFVKSDNKPEELKDKK